MRVGSLVYATDQGLGILAKSFYDARVLTDVHVLLHRHRANHLDWYPGSKSSPIGSPDLASIRRLCLSVDVMLFFETPFVWSLIDHCRQHKVRTVLMPMYECMPKVLPYQPDRFICPSLLDLRYYPDRSRSTFIPVPVSVPWRQRHRARVFVHNAGHGGLLNRNGTGQILDAMKLVKSPLKLILRSQRRLQWGVDDPRIDYRVGNLPYDQLWNEGDVFVFPEKFNGLSLPMQEARASGMVVMATHRYPNTEWLPSEWLIPTSGSIRSAISPRCLEFDEAVVSPEAIASRMDEIYDQDIAHYSMLGRAWARTMSWEHLKSKYLETLLCE